MFVALNQIWVSNNFKWMMFCHVFNNSRFCDYLHFIYPNGFEEKDSTNNQKSASYLGLHPAVDNKRRLKTFSIVKFPFISSSIPESSAYGVYIS